MARKLKPGQKVREYEVIELLNTGAMALAYSARDASGSKVFLKQYKSPSIHIPWYRDYVTYQDKINQAIQSADIKYMVVDCEDMFEEKAGPPTYFQVFEFVEGGEDLGQILEKIHKSPSSITWTQRELFAKVLMASIRSLHNAGIIHCDFKPQNLQLFRDSEIKAGYRLKLIDMDFSILDDLQAPWHGEQGYVGTPGYMSPEHLQGPKPLKASDIFTCGLILFELLTKNGHPYLYDAEQYREAALKHEAPRPELLDRPSGSADYDMVAEAIHQCLAPNPDDRPTAEELLNILNGTGAAGTAAKSGKSPRKPEKHVPPKKPGTPTPPPEEPSASTRLILTPETGAPLDMGITTVIGKKICQGMGSDAQYVAKEQFTLSRELDNTWFLIPKAGTENETMLNGKKVTDKKQLQAGDVIGVGREDKGIVKIPMKVSFGG